MPGPFNIYIVDVDPTTNGMGTRAGPLFLTNGELVKKRVYQLFDPVVRDSRSGFDRVEVTWITPGDTLAPPPDSYVVYLVDCEAHSVIATIGGTHGGTTTMGLTQTSTSGPSASEVYVREDIRPQASGSRVVGHIPVYPDYIYIGNLIFHECMHFKNPRMSNNDLHIRGGHGLASASVPEGAVMPNARNIDVLAPMLRNRLRLWLDGRDQYRRNLEAYRDVLS